MSKISSEKQERIKQEVLHILFQSNLTPISSKYIADELIRDDELILKFLLELEKLKLVKQIDKGFTKKRYWGMTPEAYSQYKKLL